MNGTLLIVIAIIAITIYFKRNDWFPRASNPLRTTTSQPTTATPQQTAPPAPATPPPASHGGGSHGTPALQSNRSNTAWAFWVNAILVVLFITSVAWAGLWVYRKYREMIGKPPTTIVVIRETPQPAPPETSKSDVLYNFSDYPDGCVTVKVTSYNFNWDTKGGRVVVTPPSGKSFVDSPNIVIKTHFTPGEWKWCKIDADATGVEITQQ